jgi:cobaltochelatase CobN
MQLLAKAVESVAELKEASNSIWRNSQRVEKDLLAQGVDPGEASYLSTIRIFSSESGSYSSGVDEAVFASDSWESDEKISDNYLSKMGYFFGSDNRRWGEKSEGLNLYAQQLSGTDIALMSRSSNLFGMISSDDPFEYFGGLSLAIRNIDGLSPDMLISNLRDADTPKAQDAAKFLATELRTRNFNKRWLQEMMKEGYSGASTLSSNLSNFWGWQVVDPSVVRDDQWQTFFEVYVEDKLELDIDEWFEQVNPASQAQMLETMLESVRKDYWQADAQTLKRLVERYVDLVENHNLFVDNEKLQEFVDGQAAGFGLKPLTEALAAAAAQAATVNEVQGQKLEQVQKPEAQEQEWDLELLAMFGVCLLMIIAGFLRQFSRPEQVRP